MIRFMKNIEDFNSEKLIVKNPVGILKILYKNFVPFGMSIERFLFDKIATICPFWLPWKHTFI